MSRSLTCGWEYRLNSSSSNGSLTADGTLADIEGGRAKIARLVRQRKGVGARHDHCSAQKGRALPAMAGKTDSDAVACILASHPTEPISGERSWAHII